MSALLGVNIDHVATLRNQRDCRYPDPVQAAMVVQEAGAALITLHLREDRRHIRERDIELIQAVKTIPLNLEMALTAEMLQFAKKIRPEQICIVPEKRAERTTEGGLDVIGHFKDIQKFVTALQNDNTSVSLFIEADPKQIEAAYQTGAKAIEIHTGAYADQTGHARQKEFLRIQNAVTQGIALGLTVNAGHGLDYHNVAPIAALAGIKELNIGYAIIARALFVGLAQAIKDMQALLRDYPPA